MQTKNLLSSKRMKLASAGLGRKVVSCEQDAIHCETVNLFPRFDDVGGYDLLRTVKKSHNLEIIMPPLEGYTLRGSCAKR